MIHESRVGMFFLRSITEEWSNVRLARLAKDSTTAGVAARHLQTRLGRSQQTTRDSAFTGHDDSVLSQDSDASTGIVDGFNSVFNLSMTNEEARVR
jgi:hypothetical protein